MYRLYISNQAVKGLKQLKTKYQEAIISALEDIKEDPLIGKPLTRDLSGSFSYRVGVYRIIYKINLIDKIVLVITAGNRASIYN